MGKLIFSEVDHSYFYEGQKLPSVTEIIRGVGLINFDGIPAEILKRAADFGRCVHQTCHYDDIGDLDEETLDDNLAPYVGAWKNFKADMVIQDFDAIEQPLAHPEYGFSGTPDRIVGNTIIDIKTGSTLPAWTALQLAGYAILAHIPAARRMAVQLKPDGKFSVVEYKNRKDREVFLCCLSVFNWKQNNP